LLLVSYWAVLLHNLHQLLCLVVSLVAAATAAAAAASAHLISLVVQPQHAHSMRRAVGQIQVTDVPAVERVQAVLQQQKDMQDHTIAHEHQICR
jgi:hypothetical protein